MRLRPDLLALALALAMIAAASPAAAQADAPVAEITRDTTISAFRGIVAWSHYDAATDRYRLALQRGGQTSFAAIAPARTPFDVSLGPDQTGRSVALYTRCESVDGGCDIYRYSIGSGIERRLDAASSPDQDEAWPVQWGQTLAFVRRRAGGGKGEIRDCDLLYVRPTSGTGPSRRLDRGSCAMTTGLSLRAGRIVQVTFGSPPNARFASQVRLLSTRGGAVRVLAQRNSGEESNAFASPSQSGAAAYLTRTGVNPQPLFVRIELPSGRLTEVRAHVTLAGPLARDTSGTSWYVESGGRRGDGCADTEPVPCRLVRASGDPFSPSERTLPPRLTITAPSDKGPRPLYTDPFVLSGRLTQAVVRRGSVVRDEPLGGLRLQLLRRIGDPSLPGLRERFAPTPLQTTTATDGTWSIRLADPPALPWYSAVARTAGVPTYAGRGTVGTVAAKITLAVSGTSFSGTVTPAQPGQVVKIQRLSARRCMTMQSGQRFCDEQWAAVADAPVDGTGTSFATVVAAPLPGTYRAAIPFAGIDRPTVYSGGSPDVKVGG